MRNKSKGMILLSIAFMLSVLIAIMFFSQIPEGITYSWILFLPAGLYLPITLGVLLVKCSFLTSKSKEEERANE